MLYSTSTLMVKKKMIFLVEIFLGVVALVLYIGGS